MKHLKEKDIKVYIIYVLFFSFMSCKTTYQDGSNPIKDLPKEIKVSYGTDMIPTKEIALKVAEIILQGNLINIHFEKMKPFNIKLIADEKVWDVEVYEYFMGHKNTYHIRLNKNTGEVLNIWTDM